MSFDGSYSCYINWVSHTGLDLVLRPISVNTTACSIWLPRWISFGSKFG